MTARKAVFGLCAICAMLFSAVAAQGASAEGTTAFTCAEGGDEFTDAHCTEEGPGPYGHVPIAEGETTEITGVNVGGTELKATAGGVSVILTATEVHGTGSMTNETVEGEMVAHGTGTLTYSNVTANHGCKVWEDVTEAEEAKMGREGVIVTHELTATTAGQGMGLKFQPKAGNVFATFWLTGCEEPFNELLDGTWEVTGYVVGTPNGATTEFTHTGTTGQETLFANGIKTGIEGELTISGRAKGSEGPYTPLTVTTE